MIYKQRFVDENFDCHCIIGKLLYTNSSLEPLTENLCGQVIGIESNSEGDSLIFKIYPTMDEFSSVMAEENIPIVVIREQGIIRHFAFSLEQ